MKNERDNSDRRLHEYLRGLPDPLPPRDLIPKVLQRIAAEPQPRWWQLPWLEWPLPLQVLSSALWAAVVGAVWFLRAGLAVLFHGAGERWTGAPHFLGPSVTALHTLWHASERLLLSLRFPWLTGAALLVIVAYLGLIGLGLVFYRVVTARSFSVE